MQQLAALLIARQVIGNLKESALPYIMEQIRLAKMSFEMFGALSPSEAESPKSETSSFCNRHISQAELESSLFKVKTLLMVEVAIFKIIVVHKVNN